MKQAQGGGASIEKSKRLDQEVEEKRRTKAKSLKLKEAFCCLQGLSSGLPALISPMLLSISIQYLVHALRKAEAIEIKSVAYFATCVEAVEHRVVSTWRD